MRISSQTVLSDLFEICRAETKTMRKWKNKKSQRCSYLNGNLNQNA